MKLRQRLWNSVKPRELKIIHKIPETPMWRYVWGVGVFEILVTVLFVLLVSLIFGLPDEKTDEFLLELGFDAFDVIFWTVLVMPFLETLVCQWAPILFLSLLIGFVFRKSGHRYLWTTVLFSAFFFAAWHGSNLDPYDWRAALIRLPAGLIWAFTTYLFVFYFKGSFFWANVRAIIVTSGLHAFSNSLPALSLILKMRSAE